MLIKKVLTVALLGFAAAQSGKLIVDSDGKAVDIVNGYMNPGDKLQLFDLHGAANQQFTFTYVVDGYYFIRSAGNPTLCVDIPYFEMENNVVLQMWPCKDINDPTENLSNQLWRIENDYSNNKMMFHSKGDDNMVIDSSRTSNDLIIHSINPAYNSAHQWFGVN